MASRNTVYDNFVLESKLKDLLTTKLDTKTLMTIDNSLTESAGMIKNINTYTYTGAVERLAKGAKNTQLLCYQRSWLKDCECRRSTVLYLHRLGR